ncbi:MAG: hypothetical protein SOY60_08570 [Fusobacterium gastrosuis]|uniref:hypothetical protein n=1 Tax=Fusobacterium gastrosuis TaxID=1755100 RepID=UPI002A8B94BF|nr:hypothetical protein [Fusobacterium gastrosuis]
MKIKAFLFFLGMITFFSESYSNNIATADTDEVVVDLNTNTLVADGGVAVKNNNISGLFYKLERDPETEIIKYSDNALVNINQNTGNIKIETKNGTLDQANEKGEFYENFAYMNVAKSTGAEAPNDRIYFGSPYVKYEKEKLYYKDGWLTTDFKIMNYSDSPKKAGYHIFSKDATIEQDKQITLFDSTLFIKDKDIFPFNIPWFRANIRKNSRVPLFPTFTNSDDYGFQTSWGVLYGNKDDKYRGGIAPKFADRMGFLIGRWENWYRSDFGETRLDIDDLLVYSKVKKDNNSSNIGDLMNYEKRNKRYRISLSHDYSGENGNFELRAVNSTKSMVGNLTDIMEKLDNNSVYKTLGMNRQKYDEDIGFYTLTSDLKNLGEDKDLSLKADVSLVSDKKGYGLIVHDSIDDIAYGSSVDHDLYSKISAVKDNKKYKLAAKYNYLYDMDPGSTSKDLMSRDERIEANFLHKDTGFEIDYKKRSGNDYRTFSLWEKDIKTTLNQKNVLGIDMNYVPTTVAKYEKNDYENINIVLGKNKFKNYLFKPSISYLTSEKALDLTKDEYRKGNLGNNRVSDYNRFDNTVYEKNLERRADFNLSNENEIYNFALGNTKSEVWDRTGLFDGTYRKYENNSNFYEATVGRKNIKTSNFGKFEIIGKFRQDKYKVSNDKTSDINLKLTNDYDINKNLNNSFIAELQRYNFSGNKDREEQRLINKSNYMKFSDTIKYSFNDKETIFKTSYKQSEDAYGKKDLNGRVFENNVTIKLDEDRKVKAFYNSDDRYTSKTLSGTNLKDLSSKYYGASYENKKHAFTFSNLDMKFNVKDVVSPVEAEEKINEHRFSYTHKKENSSLTLSYAQGKDKVEASNNGKINKRNTDYSVLYKTFNSDEEQDFFASFSENDYGHNTIRDSLRNTDVYKFSYAYRDKRFEKQELIKYATLEYEKPQDEISNEEIQAIKSMLDRSQKFNQQFELTRIVDESFRIGNYKKNFKAYVTLEKNDRRYNQTGDLMKSLSKFEGGLKYMYNRVGVGYTFTEKADWKRVSGNYDWQKKSREHELSVFAKIGKPSEGWKVKTYAKFYDNLADKSSATTNRKRSLDGLGIEIGKEMGFYEWAVSYENKYSASTKNYEWRAGIHFTLLTFPNNSVFGLGAKDSGSRKTRPDGYLLDRPSNLNDDWK